MRRATATDIVQHATCQIHNATGINSKRIVRATGQQTTCTVARQTHAQEHVVSHIMRRVVEYDNVTEVRLLLCHTGTAGEPQRSLGPILVQLMQLSACCSRTGTGLGK